MYFSLKWTHIIPLNLKMIFLYIFMKNRYYNNIMKYRKYPHMFIDTMHIEVSFWKNRDQAVFREKRKYTLLWWRIFFYKNIDILIIILYNY